MATSDTVSLANRTVAAMAAALLANLTTVSPEITEIVHSQPSQPIFLQTKLAQGVAGFFVWAALFLTCTQVGFL